MPKCARCGTEIVHVRDNYTGATFPVEAKPVPFRGYVLSPPREGERNQRADYRVAELFTPHSGDMCEPTAESISEPEQEDEE